MTTKQSSTREQMNVVIVGHVDHGKSTVIGRLMADTGSLPEGKLEQVKATCKENARPFEYAFLLDALKNEQAQGITIDTARCFFKTASRDYIINDAPGHIEFLKNMITGAARAEAALLVIDAKEGIQENSRRHGYILSMLGIRQVAVLVNKMDLVDYSEDTYNDIKEKYTEFLSSIGVTPERFIPISAIDGVNITEKAEATSWYDGPSVLGQVDDFTRDNSDAAKPFRLPVQDIYKFTQSNDDRRIIAGTVRTGKIKVGEEIRFLPSGKTTRVKSIERFNAPDNDEASAGEAIGITMTEQIYVKRGELICKKDDLQPTVTKRFRANIFWMGVPPLIKDKRYKLKIGATAVPVELAEIKTVLDASELSSVLIKQQVERHDVAEVIFETARPIAFDLSSQVDKTSRFVIVDEHEIAGCGIALEEVNDGESLLVKRVRNREFAWEKGAITRDARIAGYGHAGKFIVVASDHENSAAVASAFDIAKQLERKLFASQKHTYFLSLANVFGDLAGNVKSEEMSREEHILQLGQLARLMTDSGLLFITSIADADADDLEKLRILNEPSELFLITVGEVESGNVKPAVSLPENLDTQDGLVEIIEQLNAHDVIPDYCI